jgi:hypothetical protein
MRTSYLSWLFMDVEPVLPLEPPTAMEVRRASEGRRAGAYTRLHLSLT